MFETTRRNAVNSNPPEGIGYLLRRSRWLLALRASDSFHDTPSQMEKPAPPLETLVFVLFVGATGETYYRAVGDCNHMPHCRFQMAKFRLANITKRLVKMKCRFKEEGGLP